MRRGISVIGGAMADRLGTTTDCHSRLGVCTVGDAPFPAPPVGETPSVPASAGTPCPRGIVMSDVTSFTEIENQHAELLPPRTVLSLLPTNITAGRGEGNAPGAKAQDAAATTWMALFGYDNASDFGNALTDVGKPS